MMVSLLHPETDALPLCLHIFRRSSSLRFESVEPDHSFHSFRLAPLDCSIATQTSLSILYPLFHETFVAHKLGPPSIRLWHVVFDRGVRHSPSQFRSTSVLWRHPLDGFDERPPHVIVASQIRRQSPKLRPRPKTSCVPSSRPRGVQGSVPTGPPKGRNRRETRSCSLRGSAAVGVVAGDAAGFVWGGGRGMVLPSACYPCPVALALCGVTIANGGCQAISRDRAFFVGPAKKKQRSAFFIWGGGVNGNGMPHFLRRRRHFLWRWFADPRIWRMLITNTSSVLSTVKEYNKCAHKKESSKGGQLSRRLSRCSQIPIARPQPSTRPKKMLSCPRGVVA